MYFYDDKMYKIKVALLTGTVTVGIIGGAFTLAYLHEKKIHLHLTDAPSTSQSYDIGKHVISVPLSDEYDLARENYQFQSISGYEPIGLTLKGKTGGAILYSNKKEVNCISSAVNEDGNYYYGDFGTPIDNSEDEYTKKEPNEFNIGEHIISVPMNNCSTDENIQYDLPEGYEIVGIATSSYGKYSNYSGGALLYKNVVPVKCHLEEKGYTSFGTPIENEKVKTLDK